MPRFFFTFRDAGHELPDAGGIVCADAYAARREALLVVGDLLDKRSRALPDEWKGWSLAVRDVMGRLVLDLPFTAAAKHAALHSRTAFEEERRRADPAREVVPLRLVRAHRRFAELRKQMRSVVRVGEDLMGKRGRAAQQLQEEIRTARRLVAHSRALLERSQEQEPDQTPGDESKP
jgi:hypothetical protein